MIADKTWNMLPDKGKAIMLAQREVASFVCDAVNLEGIPFTLPEIQTLLDGITVGGHRLEEQQIAVNQGNAWKHLFASLQSGSFILSAEYACKLHDTGNQESLASWCRAGGKRGSADMGRISPGVMIPESAKPFWWRTSRKCMVLLRCPWAEPGSGFTAMFEALVIDWLKEASTAAVSRLMGLSWNAIDGIMQRACHAERN